MKIQLKEKQITHTRDTNRLITSWLAIFNRIQRTVYSDNGRVCVFHLSHNSPANHLMVRRGQISFRININLCKSVSITFHVLRKRICRLSNVRTCVLQPNNGHSTVRVGTCADKSMRHGQNELWLYEQPILPIHLGPLKASNVYLIWLWGECMPAMAFNWYLRIKQMYVLFHACHFPLPIKNQKTTKIGAHNHRMHTILVNGCLTNLIFFFFLFFWIALHRLELRFSWDG